MLFLLEEEKITPGYSAQLADLQSSLCESFPENRNIIMFSVGIDMVVFLIKSDKERIDAETQRCVNLVNNIISPLDNTVSSYVVTGTPVERLSAVADCYRVVRKQLFHRHMTDESNDDFYIGSERPDQHMLEKFLNVGSREDIDNFLNDFFFRMSEKAIHSMMFRQYFIINTRITITDFLKKIGYTNEEIEVPSGAEIRISASSAESAVEYLRDCLVYALDKREHMAKKSYVDVLRKATEYIRENYADPDMSLNSAAKIANVSPTYFSAVFSRELNKTFIEYLTELRMDKARELLRCSDKTSATIAYEVGYNSPHYFSALFKKVNGVTPREYRAKGDTAK